MRKYWWLLILPVLALLLWWALSQGRSAPVIHFSTAKQATLSSTVTTNGKVEPADWSAARAETSGVVRLVSVRRGQQVTAGQTLVTLDTTAAAADLAAAIAREQEAQADVNTLSQGGKAGMLADVNGRIAAAREAVSVAQRIYDSDQRLLPQHAITKLQVDTDRDTLARAKLTLAALENQRKSLATASDQSVAAARLSEASSAVALARHRLQVSVIKAPMSGTVYQLSTAAPVGGTPVDIKVGTYLQPGDLVALVGDIDEVKVVVDVDEPDLGRVSLGMPIRITSDSYPGQTWWGKVNKLPTQIIALGTRTVGQVSTTVSNPRHDLLPGVSVNATIISKVEKSVLVVPKASLRRLANSDGVYKLAGDVIQWTPVKTGISDINNVQILSGLSAGDRVADRAVEPSDAEILNGMRAKPVFD